MGLRSFGEFKNVYFVFDFFVFDLSTILLNNCCPIIIFKKGELSGKVGEKKCQLKKNLLYQSWSW